jgi:hypothetical protein
MEYVKIITCDSNKSWYKDKVGETFLVFPMETVRSSMGEYCDVYFLKRKNGVKSDCAISKRNCIVVTREMKLERILKTR